MFLDDSGGKYLFGFKGTPVKMDYVNETKTFDAYFMVGMERYSSNWTYYNLEGKKIKNVPKREDDWYFFEEDISDFSGTENPEVKKSVNKTTKTTKINGTYIYNYNSNISPLYIAEQNNFYGVITEKEEIIVPLIYDDIFQTPHGFLQINKDEKVGWLAKTGEEITPLIYDDIRPVFITPDQNYDSLFQIEKNGKFGIIDHYGTVLIPPIYPHLNTDFEGVKNQIGLAKLQENTILSDAKVYEIDFSKGDYKKNLEFNYLIKNDPNCFVQQNEWVKNNLFFPAKKDKYWGLIDLNNQNILPFEYDSLNMLTGALVALKKNNQIRFYDLVLKKDLGIVCDTFFQQRNSFSGKEDAAYKRFLIYRNKGKYGILDIAKRTFLPATYDAVEQTYINSFDVYNYFQGDDISTIIKENTKKELINSMDLIRFKKNGLYGLINLTELNEVMAKTYQEVHVNSSYFQPNCIIQLDNKMTFATDKSFSFFTPYFDSVSTLTSFDWSDIKFYDKPFSRSYRERLYLVEKNGLVGVYTNKGEVVLPVIYEELSYWTALNEAANDQFIVKKDGKYGIVKKGGLVYIPFIYDQIKFNSSKLFPWQYELFLNDISIFKPF